MAKYRVQGPDGAIHLIEGPDDATPAQIEAFAAQSIPAATNPMRKQGTNATDYAGDAAKAGMGFAQGLGDLVRGGAQAALHYVSPYANDTTLGLRDALDRHINEREADYQAQTPGSGAAGLGRLVGNMLMPVAPVRVAAGTTLLPRIANAGATGATIGAMQPVTGAPEDYTQNKLTQILGGGVAGTGLSTLGALVGGGFNALRPLFNPRSAAGNKLAQAVSQDGTVAAPELIQRLQGAQSLVPGSLPTTAQVAGMPQMVMAEKAMRNNPTLRTAFDERANANNAARMAALRQVAGTPEDLAAAMEARSKASGPLYDAAAGETHAVDPTLTAILARPSAQSAIARGQKLAAEKGETVGVTTPQASLIVGANGQPMAPAAAPSIDGKTLQYLKMGVDDLQKEGKVAGMGAHEAAALGATRNDLDSWLTANSPTFKNASATYAAHSVPINTMQAGQSILEPLENGTLNATGDVAPALSQFRTRYAKALADSPYGIDPQAKATLDAIQADLQRETISNSVRSSGSDTALNLAASSGLGSSWLAKAAGAAGGFVTGGPMAAYGGYKAAQGLGQFGASRVNNELQQAMLDPVTFANMLRAASERSPGMELLGNQTIGAGTNALARLMPPPDQMTLPVTYIRGNNN